MQLLPTLKVSHFEPKLERRRESLFSLGNGFLLVRSALPWARTSDVHYPGTYAAGCYNQLPSQIAGETVWDDSIVKLPNGLSVSISLDGASLSTLSPDEVQSYEQELILREGLMRRTLTVRDKLGRLTDISEERFVSMGNPNIIGMRIRVMARNWGGEISIANAIDGSVVNGSISKHADFSHQHLVVKNRRADANRLHLEAQTSNSGLRIDVGTVTMVDPARPPLPFSCGDNNVGIKYDFSAEAERSITVETLATVIVQEAEEHPRCDDPARRASAGAPSYQVLRQEHVDAWEELWAQMPFEAEDEELALSVQLSLFHLLQNYSPNSIGRDVGLPARGWQEVYRGQIFWDEMFAVPVLSLRFPALAREILLYRYSRLQQARENARKKGLRGALYPWRSARSGTEATPRFQKFMKSGRWHEDHTDLQVHVNGSIAWDILHYVWATGDNDFLERKGLEVLVEIARLWSSLATYDEVNDRFHIAGIVGPDEFHTHYQDREEPGLSDNAYTNVVAAWTLVQLLALLEEVPAECRLSLRVADAELKRWEHLSRRMYLAFSPDGLISQFDGVEALPQLDPEQFGKANVQWELEAEGRDANDYQIFKQADFAMLLYLFGPDELLRLFKHLDYEVGTAQLHRSLDHYRKLTTHNSSLSEVSYAAGLAFFDVEASWQIWRSSLGPDLDPAHAEGTAEGLHLGAMAASLDVLQRRYLGLVADWDGLRLEPLIPRQLPPLSLGFVYRNGRFRLTWDGLSLKMSACHENLSWLTFRHRGRKLTIPPGTVLELEVTELA